LDRDPAAGHQLRAAAAQGGGERRRPDVLIDQDAGRAARFDDRSGLVDVVGSEQPGGRPFEDREIELAVAVEVGDGQCLDRAVQVAPDEPQVEDPDDAGLVQVDQDREPLPGHPVARELHHDVVDRTRLVEFCAHRIPFVEVAGRLSVESLERSTETEVTR
jgi:hypothetical protein